MPLIKKRLTFVHNHTERGEQATNSTDQSSHQMSCVSNIQESIQKSSPNIIIEAWTGNMMKYLFQTEMAKNVAKILFPSGPLLTCLLELSIPDTFNSISESKPTKPQPVTPHICYVTLPSFETSSIRTYQRLTATSIFLKIFTAKGKCRHWSP